MNGKRRRNMARKRRRRLQSYWDFIKCFSTNKSQERKEEVINAWKNVRKKMTKEDVEMSIWFKIINNSVIKLERNINDSEIKICLEKIKDWCSNTK